MPPHWQKQERPFGRAPKFPSAFSSTSTSRPHRLRITREQLRVQVPEPNHPPLSSEEQLHTNSSYHYRYHDQVSNDLGYFTIHRLSKPTRDAIHNSQEHLDSFLTPALPYPKPIFPCTHLLPFICFHCSINPSLINPLPFLILPKPTLPLPIASMISHSYIHLNCPFPQSSTHNLFTSTVNSSRAFELTSIHSTGR